MASGIFFLALAASALSLLRAGWRHVGLDPLEPEGISELPLSKQRPRRLGMFLNDAMQQPFGVAGRGSGLFTILDGRVGYESPGISPWGS